MSKTGPPLTAGRFFTGKTGWFSCKDESCPGRGKLVYYTTRNYAHVRRPFHEAHGHRRQFHYQPGLLRDPDAHHPGRHPHQRRLRLCQHPAQAVGGGETGGPVRYLRPQGPHLPPPGLRRLQGPAQGDARRAGRPASHSERGPGGYEHPPL